MAAVVGLTSQQVIEVCKKALSQKWAGDWEHRIEECEKKLNNKKS
jgi:hypothetical protein